MAWQIVSGLSPLRVTGPPGVAKDLFRSEQGVWDRDSDTMQVADSQGGFSSVF
jgi:hypothetical protein